MNQRFKFLSILIFVIGLGFFGYSWWSWSNKSSSPALEQPIESATNTAGCLNPRPGPATVGLLGGKIDSTTYTLDDPYACYHVGDAVSVRVQHSRIPVSSSLQALFKSDSVVVMQPLQAGESSMTGTVKEIYALSSEGLKLSPEEISNGIQSGNPELMREIVDSIRRMNRRAPVSILRIELNKPPEIRYSRISPTFPRLMGRIVTADNAPEQRFALGQLSTVTQLGATVIDVRSQEEFSRSHHPGAIHIPYVEKHPVDIALAENFLPHPDEDQFDLHKLPKDKDRILVFVGEGLHDPRASKAQILVKAGGWEKASVLFGGERARLGKALMTPTETPNEIKVLSPSEAVALVNQQSGQILDIRSEQERAIRAIAGSKTAEPFVERSKIAALVHQDRELAPTEIDALKSAIAIEKINSSTPLILVGMDEMDWRPLNFARILKAQGAGFTIYWMREGLGGWLQMASKTPDVYQTTSASHQK